MREHPLISASPDLDVSCDCCGDGLAEFKCLPLVKIKFQQLKIYPALKSERGKQS